MRHGMANRKLGRTSSHRKAMFRNQLASLIDNERIITTLPKAKELRPLAEKLITLAKNDSVHTRRQAFQQVPDDSLIAKLFDTLGPRRGDAAEMAILELVERSADKTEAKSAEPATPAKGGKKKAAAPKAEEAAAEEKPKRTRKAAPKAEAEAPAAEAKPKKTTRK